MLEFVLARYNYWIVIALMMTGLYIVFSRGNLVKTLIGLNLFQTSVFIFYITVGKVQGGTAPILIEDKSKKKDDGHGGGHDAAAHGATDHGGDHGHSEAPTGMINEASGAPITSREDAARIAAERAAEGAAAPDIGGHLETPGIIPGATEVYSGTGEGLASTVPTEIAGDILYSNPLPHVLILTAIVVGVATTSVGLALAVRIREAYGTVEQDQLEALDMEEETAEAVV